MIKNYYSTSLVVYGLGIIVGMLSLKLNTILALGVNLLGAILVVIHYNLFIKIINK